MLHAFRIGFRGFGGKADSEKQLDDEVVARTDPLSEFAACLRQEDAADERPAPGRSLCMAALPPKPRIFD